MPLCQSTLVVDITIKTLYATDKQLVAARKTTYKDVASHFIACNEFTHLSDLYFPDKLTNDNKHKKKGGLLKPSLLVLIYYSQLIIN